MLAQTSISTRIKVEGHSAPPQVRRLGRHLRVCRRSIVIVLVLVLVLVLVKDPQRPGVTPVPHHVEKGPRPKNGAPTLCSLSAANKSADITLDQSMAYAEKLRLQAQKVAAFGQRKSAIFRHFPPCIQGAGQRGPGAVKESVRQPIGPDEVRFTADGVSRRRRAYAAPRCATNSASSTDNFWTSRHHWGLEAWVGQNLSPKSNSTHSCSTAG